MLRPLTCTLRERHVRSIKDGEVPACRNPSASPMDLKAGDTVLTLKAGEPSSSIWLLARASSPTRQPVLILPGLLCLKLQPDSVDPRLLFLNFSSSFYRGRQCLSALSVTKRQKNL